MAAAGPGAGTRRQTEACVRVRQLSVRMEEAQHLGSPGAVRARGRGNHGGCPYSRDRGDTRLTESFSTHKSRVLKPGIYTAYFRAVSSRILAASQLLE